MDLYFCLYTCRMGPGPGGDPGPPETRARQDLPILVYRLFWVNFTNIGLLAILVGPILLILFTNVGSFFGNIAKNEF